MSNSFFLKLPLLLAVIFLIAGCSVSDAGKQAITNDAVDIYTYKATTPEAQKVIDGIKAGSVQKPAFISGGYTDSMITERIMSKEKQMNTPTGNDGSILKSVQPGEKPTSPETRPKIFWIGKLYGPGETYIVNAETFDYHFENYLPNAVMTLKTTTWKNSGGGTTTYHTALLQNTGIKTDSVRYGDWGNNYFNWKVLAVDHPIFNDDNYIILIYDRSVITNDYLYTNLPSNVFEDPGAYPIQETWYWNPPWHFEKISMNQQTSGAITFDVDTREGFEQQFMIFRWDINDFNAAYTGWHDQGWYIKDFDVNNGIISAILYVPASPYTEVRMWNVNDSEFWNNMSNYYWPNGYRGLMLDSSW
jgi:hypothetical protein